MTKDEVRLYTDEEIRTLESEAGKRVAVFISDLQQMRALYPDVEIRVRVDESSEFIAIDEEDIAGLPIERQEQVDTILLALADASDYRSRPRIDVAVCCDSDNRRHVRSAAETISLYARVHGGKQIENSGVERNESGEPFTLGFMNVKNPHDGRPEYKIYSVYRFTGNTEQM